MRVMNRSTKLTAMAVTLVALAAIWMAWPVSRSAADEEYLDEFLAYGVANISPGQTARLHVVTVGIPDTQPTELVIYDRQGNILARSRERLLPGRTVALDLPFPESPGIAVVGNRLEFYAVVRFAGQRGRDRGYIIPSLEVMDSATGRTILMVLDPLG